MSLNNRLYKLGLLTGLVAWVPLWGQSISISNCPAQAGPGNTFTCTVSAALGTAQADSLTFNVQAANNGGAPAATGGTFNSAVSGLSSISSGNNAGGFAASLAPPVTGNVTLGTIQFTIPSYTAAAGQSYTVAFTAASYEPAGTTNTVNFSLGASSSINVSVVLTLPAAGPLPTGTVGAAYSTTLTASGGTGPYTWTAPSLAALGLNISGTGATATIGGTPSATANAAGILVTVKDSSSTPQTQSQTYTLTINAAPSITTASLATGTVGTAYSQNMTASGGTTPLTWSASGLPGTLTINASTGAITGTPTAAFSGTVTIKATDANGAFASQNYTLTITGPLQITSPSTGSSLTTGTVGTAYSTTISAAGGSPAYSWSASNLPGGLSINAGTGVIGGTPTAAGSFSGISVTVKDQANATVTATYSMMVNSAITVTGPSSLTADTINVAYPSTTATATGGGGSYTWSATGLPAGMSIAPSTGVISGTPTASGAFNVTVTATDTNSATGSKTLPLTIYAALTITGPAALPGATATFPYPATSVTVSGGNGSYTWSATGLPSSMSINPSNGAISGTPASAGSSTVVVTVTDTASNSTNKTYTLTVNPAPSITGPASLPLGTANWPYTSTTVTASGGTSPLTWTAAGLPAGLTIGAATGAISGTPTTSTGSPFSVTVTATDANSATATKSYSLSVNPALTITGPASLPVGIPGVAYTATTVTATGGAGAPYTWSATGLPAAMTINSGTGVISGVPASNSGSPFTVVVTATDSNSVKATKTYTLAVAPPLSISGPSSLPAGTVSVPYVATTVSATGGTAPYSWSATGLPPGLSINSGSGTISGNPTAVAGSPYAVTVTVTDANGTTAKMNYSIAVGALPLTITGGPLPNGVINVPYPYTTIPATGGVGNYSWSITGLPPGLTTDGNGDISGTPTTTTGSPFTVVATVTDATLTSASRTYTVNISGALTVALPSTPGLPTANLNAPYSTTITAGGGAAPYTWAATGLPPGLSIGVTTGAIGGAPTSNSGSPYSVTVTVTDSTGKTANKTYSLVVSNATLLSITGPAALPTGFQGVPYTATTVTATGGSGTYTWSVTGQPLGLTIASGTGVISGTPAANSAGNYTVAVTVTDSTGATATKNYPLVIGTPPPNQPTISSVSTSAGGQPMVAPNTYVSIYGTNFAAAGFTDTWTNYVKNNNGNLPISLDGVSVAAGGQNAYIYYISNTQINVLLPNVGLGQIQFVVTTAAGPSNAVTVTSQTQIPAFFPWPTPSGTVPGDSTAQPVATHLDFTYAVANGTFQGLTTVPAKPGETIVLWGSGFGPTTPATPFGIAVPNTTIYNTSNNVTVSLNGAPAAVYNNIATLAPGAAGLYQVAVTIPASLPNGSYPITTSVNGVTSPPLTLLVHN